MHKVASIEHTVLSRTPEGFDNEQRSDYHEENEKQVQ
jgi:hypothetical protein